MMAKQYKQKPSNIVNIDNDYEAFCFDEACAYILAEMQKENAKEPNFDINVVEKPRNNADLIAYFKRNNRK